MIEPKDIILVTLTYGDRWQLLRQSLVSAYNEGIKRIILVDNGVSYNIEDAVFSEFRDMDISITVLSLGGNTGSAIGYRRGLEGAMDSEGEFILLLDDDGQLQGACVGNLLSAYEELCPEGAKDNTAVSAIRMEHNTDLKEGVLDSTLNRRSSFRRFHIADLPYRLLRRFEWVNRIFFKSISNKHVRVPYTVYSGLLFHKDLIKRHGFPEESFVLYGDDLEFTYRITSSGGAIWIITDARIKDLEISWWCRKKFGNPFDALILGGNDRVVFYAFRNEVYFETYCMKRRGVVYHFHRLLYMGMLFMNALFKGRLSRFRVLYRALRDGTDARLGINKDFPI